ncbi:DUF1652 domain-containing protein [Pseudomonas massiliensis]|uniref:DUF1652 domain-containing protein n=1 Tax=Pseudomonas massiliensis TaxID=522492 RepID=UPI000A000AE1|nr:DUF1652 domain-containing protein [Pseudomonas massiliensis]
MKTIGLSPLEIRGIVEQAFLPLACTCEHADDDEFNIRIEDLHSGKLMLAAEGISPDRFASSREICALIADLRTRLEQHQAFPASIVVRTQHVHSSRRL